MNQRMVSRREHRAHREQTSAPWFWQLEQTNGFAEYLKASALCALCVLCGLHLRFLT